VVASPAPSSEHPAKGAGQIPPPTIPPTIPNNTARSKQTQTKAKAGKTTTTMKIEQKTLFRITNGIKTRYMIGTADEARTWATNYCDHSQQPVKYLAVPLVIYDNGGKTFDRITVVYLEDKFRSRATGNITYSYLGASETGVGFFQHGECEIGRHLGKKIKFSDMDSNLQRLIKILFNETNQNPID